MILTSHLCRGNKVGLNFTKWKTRGVNMPCAWILFFTYTLIPTLQKSYRCSHSIHLVSGGNGYWYFSNGAL